MSKFKFEIGEESGCVFDDIIYIPLSPTRCEFLENILKKKAENSMDYGKQELYHELKNLFEEAHRAWREERRRGNERN